MSKKDDPTPSQRIDNPNDNVIPEPDGDSLSSSTSSTKNQTLIVRKQMMNANKPVNGSDVEVEETGSDDSCVSTTENSNEKLHFASSSSVMNNSTISTHYQNCSTFSASNYSCQDKSTNTIFVSATNEQIDLSSSTDSGDFEWSPHFSPDFVNTTKRTNSILPVNSSFSWVSLPHGSASTKCPTASSWSNQQQSSLRNCSSIPNNVNFLKQSLPNIESKHGQLDSNRSTNSNLINSLLLFGSNICRAAHHHHHHHYHNHPNHNRQIVQNCQVLTKNLNIKKDTNNFEMSSIQATKIISNHSNSEINSTNSNSGSSAITTLTSSSYGHPVSALTVLESPKTTLNNRSHNWQAYMPTLKNRMATIFNRDILADVYFIVGKKTKTRFAAHKFVLSIGSAVFDTMFNGLLAKSNDSEVEKKDLPTEIELPDIEPEAFQALLRFLYLDEVEIGPETVIATLYAAKKYEVLALEVACVNFLKANLNAENAFMLLTQARLFDETNLADLCLEMIDKHTMNALQSDYFLEIDLDTLKTVISRDTLRVREGFLFSAVVKWTESECLRRNLAINGENKRQILSDALYLLRFPLMTIEEFAVYAAQSGLLTDKEVVNLFLYYTLEFKDSIPFSFEPRCCITGEEYSVNRFQRIESRWGYSGTSDRIKFLVDRPIFVIGFGLYGSILGQSEYEVLIEISHTGSGKVLASNNTTFTSDGSDSTFKVMFQYPVEIAKNTNYTARATLKGVDSYYGTNGCRTLTVDLGKGHNKDSVTFQFSYAAGCNNGTSVEDGQIPEIIFHV